MPPSCRRGRVARWRLVSALGARPGGSRSVASSVGAARVPGEACRVESFQEGAGRPAGRGDTISDLLERLRERHWRVTPQRRVIAEVLDGEHVHLSAETVHVRAHELLPEISLATVYNTLNELVAMGELLEVSAGSGPKRYDPNVTVPHDHLVCTTCGTLRDVVASNTSLVGTLEPTQRHGFLVTGVDIVFRGICPQCAGEGALHPTGAPATLPS